MRGSERAEQVGWWSGIVSVCLIGAGFFAIDAGGTTDPDGSISILVHEVTTTHGQIVFGNMVGMIGALLLIWFGAALRIRLARDGDAGSMIGLAAFGSAVLMSGGALAHAAFRLSETAINAVTLSEAMRPLAILDSHSSDVYGWGMIALAVALSVGGFAVGLIPKPLAAFGAIVSVVAIGFSQTTHGGAALALFPWLIAVCVVLILRSRSS